MLAQLADSPIHSWGPTHTCGQCLDGLSHLLGVCLYLWNFHFFSGFCLQRVHFRFLYAAGKFCIRMQQECKLQCFWIYSIYSVNSTLPCISSLYLQPVKAQKLEIL